MKKRIICVVVLLAVCFVSLTGCNISQNVSEENETENLEIVEEEKVEVLTGLNFEVPSGFVEDETRPGYYVSENYEEDYACIYYQEAKADERYSLLTEETIAELMQEIYSKLYGIETVVEVKDFHRFNLDGYEAYCIETEYNVDDLAMHSCEYTVISGEQIYSVTYVQRQNGGWKAAFAHSAENLQVVGR